MIIIQPLTYLSIDLHSLICHKLRMNRSYHIKNTFLFIFAVLFVMNSNLNIKTESIKLNGQNVVVEISQNNDKSTPDDTRKICRGSDCLSVLLFPYQTRSSESRENSKDHEFESSELIMISNISENLASNKYQQYLISTNLNFYYKSSFFPQSFRPPIIS